MNLHNNIIHSLSSSSLRKNNSIIEVRCKSSALGINSDHPKLLPYLLQQNIQSQLHGNRYTSIKWIHRYLIHLLDRNSINLVENVDTLDVLSVSFDHIDELVDVVVATEGDVGVVHLVLVHDVDHHLLVDFGELAVRVELDTASFHLLDGDVWSRFVQADADSFELGVEFDLLLFTFLAVEDHENDISSLTDSDDLLSSTLAVCCALNDTWKIQQLHLSVIDIEHTWNTSKSCKLISSCLTRSTAKLVE
jgi:hypothetical protein